MNKMIKSDEGKTLIDMLGQSDDLSSMETAGAHGAADALIYQRLCVADANLSKALAGGNPDAIVRVTAMHAAAYSALKQAETARQKAILKACGVLPSGKGGKKGDD